VTDTTDRAAVADAFIAERPCTITVYRRDSSSETGETTLDSFTGRVDERGTNLGRDLSPKHEGTVAVVTYILLCPQDNRVVQAKDLVKVVDESDVTTWFYVLSTRDYGYKMECILVGRDDV